jgi:hypothetical protein
MTQAKTWYSKASNYNIKGPPDHIDENSATATMCACAYFDPLTSEETFLRVIFDLASYSISPKVTYDPEES